MLGNDTDVDSPTLTAVLVSGTSNGVLSFNSSGSFTYTPNSNFNGTDSFTYKANDGALDSNVATVTITVNAVNDAPVANPDSFTVDEDNTLTIGAPGVLGNDTDVDSPTLTAVLVSSTSNGVLSLNSNGSFSYTPNSNFNGTDTFTYKANDGALDSNVATLTITVNAVNDAPVAVDDSATTDEDSAVTIAVLANDTDVDGDTLTVSAITQPTNGAAVINGNGTVTYTPLANFHGADSFTYTVSDGHGGTDTATVSLTVRSVNDAPVAVNDGASTDEDTAVTVNVLANDTDVDGDTLTPVVASGPAHGTVVVNADGTFTYTPHANFNGTDSFTYQASDGALSSNEATVAITIRAVNNAPVAVNDSYTVGQDTLLNVPAAGVLANDTDVEGNALTAVLVAGPAHGSLVLNADGSFTYKPGAGFIGTDTFTYKANDGAADSNVATVAIQVNATANTEGRVNGGGYVDGGRRRFNLDVHSRARRNGFAFTGQVSFRDLENKITLRSKSITGFQIDASGQHAVITGTARVNGQAGYTFMVMVSDLANPGRGADKFRILITGPDGFSYDSLNYASAEGLLDSGNIRVRRRA